VIGHPINKKERRRTVWRWQEQNRFCRFLFWQNPCFGLNFEPIPSIRQQPAHFYGIALGTNDGYQFRTAFLNE
jgi:hypothetical protein